MQLLICNSNHFIFLYNIHKNSLDFFASSLFSHTPLFTLAFHIIILLLFFSFLVQLLTCHSNHFKFLHKIYKYIFHFFAFLSFSHTHSFTLAHYIYIIQILQSCSLVQLLTTYPYHFKFLHNILKYIFDFSVYSLFSHTALLTLAFQIIILLLQLCFLCNY